jgi:hypothetical protein
MSNPMMASSKGAMVMSIEKRTSVRSNRPPLVSRPGDPEPLRERAERSVMIPVSTGFWRKARAICTTKMKVSEIFERAMDLAIEDHVAKAIAPLKPPPLPDHHHQVHSMAGEAVYFFGRLGIAVDEKCRLIGVGVAPHADDA